MAEGTKKKQVLITGAVLTFLVGVSRCCLGVHYPTDVLAGWCVGIAAALAVPRLKKLLRSETLFHVLIIAAAFSGWFFCRSDDYYSAFGMLVGFVLVTVFEEKYVRFANTRNPLCAAVRVAGGLAVFLGLNALLKMAFSAPLFSEGVWNHAARAVRYGLLIFADLGLYPMTFRYMDRFLSRKST